jgi:phospho-2-dehydro-3-deoxyheptonate aldolase
VLAEELPLPDPHAQAIAAARRTIEKILDGADPRLLAIVGPCSVHDPAALLEFARRFQTLCEHLTDALFPVLRVYFERPRTVESQIHRELASGISMPVGFKNATSGEIDVAIDAIHTAAHSHWFPSLTKEGTPTILQSTGNPHAYLILRGDSRSGPNYHAGAVQAAATALAERSLTPSLIVDCSHGNSGKEPARQALVLSDLCDQIEQGERGIRGVMLESHLAGGSQPVVPGEALIYGQSITDPCLSLAETAPLLQLLAAAVRRVAA